MLARAALILLATASLFPRPVVAEDSRPPDAPPSKFLGLIGEYGPDGGILYILEKDGQLQAQARRFTPFPLKEIDEDIYHFPEIGPQAVKRFPSAATRTAGRPSSTSPGRPSLAGRSTARMARPSGSSRSDPSRRSAAKRSASSRRASPTSRGSPTWLTWSSRARDQARYPLRDLQ